MRRALLPALTATIALAATAHAAPPDVKVTGSIPALTVTVTNTAAAPIDAAITASDGRHVYPAARRVIAAGDTVTVTLKAPKALAREARRRRATRRPRVTVVNLATAESVRA